jgi:formamidopyrimidine-DNA glycosylase
VPELPEVETIARELAPRLTGRRIKQAALRKTDVLRRVSKPRLLRTLKGNTVAGVERRAKHAVIRLESGHRLVIQPRMTGSLIVHDQPLDAAESRYAVLTCALDDGRLFVYRDVRRLGTVWLLDDRGWAAYDAKLGPEPLLAEFTVERFAERLRGTRAAIKKAIMDQRRVVGVGNIYANEALFAAGIDPSRSAAKLSGEEMALLHREIQDVLRRAISSKGTTVSDYRTGTGESGSFQFELKVYDRAGEPCMRCGTTLATTHAVDGRQTTFCYNCQR